MRERLKMVEIMREEKRRRRRKRICRFVKKNKNGLEMMAWQG